MFQKENIGGKKVQILIFRGEIEKNMTALQAYKINISKLHQTDKEP